MKFIGMVAVVLAAAFALAAADPALARAKHKHRTVRHVVSHCHPAPARFWYGLFEARDEPRPNGCAPAVYQYGKFVGQDPDPNIRHQLLRDPATGYSAVNND